MTIENGNGLTRRSFLGAAAAGSASLLLGACTTSSQPSDPEISIGLGPLGYAEMYGAKVDDGHNIPAVPIDRIDRRYYRQVVNDPTGEKPGTVVVDTANHFLYLVQPNRKAIRYGVGLGRAGFEWSGNAVIQWKRKWPTWTPPAEMIARQPELKKYSAENGGMKPGITNPLGARALYIFKDGVDTLYRLHGNPEWNSIGRSVSSGCVRLMNQDIIDLYDRVPNRTPIVVTSGLRTRLPFIS